MVVWGYWGFCMYNATELGTSRILVWLLSDPMLVPMFHSSMLRDPWTVNSRFRWNSRVSCNLACQSYSYDVSIGRLPHVSIIPFSHVKVRSHNKSPVRYILVDLSQKVYAFCVWGSCHFIRRPHHLPPSNAPPDILVGYCGNYGYRRPSRAAQCICTESPMPERPT